MSSLLFFGAFLHAWTHIKPMRVTCDNMLQIAYDITQAVTSGQFTLQEAFKFSNFLKHQRRLIDDAEDRKRAWTERSIR